MAPRVQEQDGFLLIEVVAAMMIVSIALLAVMAGYDSAFVSLHKSGQKQVASQLAEQQLELYSALPYQDIGLSADAVAAVGTTGGSTYDALYAENTLLDGLWDPVNNDYLPSGTVNDVTMSPCASESGEDLDNCAPVQNVTGSDGRPYRIDTFIRDEPNNTAISWPERIVTVIVRDDSSAGADAEILREQTAFDRGPQ
jgi:type II secretory pathway pseudopilin PulG